MKTQKLNLSSYGVTEMNDSEIRNIVGGIAGWIVVAGVVIVSMAAGALVGYLVNKKEE